MRFVLVLCAVCRRPRRGVYAGLSLALVAGCDDVPAPVPEHRPGAAKAAPWKCCGPFSKGGAPIKPGWIPDPDMPRGEVLTEDTAADTDEPPPPPVADGT